MTDISTDLRDYATKAELTALEARIVEAEKNLAADAELIHEIDERLHILEEAADGTEPPTQPDEGDGGDTQPPPEDEPTDPPTEPSEPPDDEPTDPLPDEIVDLLIEDFDPFSVVSLIDHYSTGRYSRTAKRIRFRGEAGIGFFHASGETLEGVYELQFQKPLGEWFRVTTAQSDTDEGVFEFDSTTIPSGVYWARIVDENGMATCPRVSVFVVNERFEQTHFPVHTPSYRLQFEKTAAVSALIPLGYKPRKIPTRARPEGDVHGMAYTHQVVPRWSNDIIWPTVGKYGEIGGSDNDQVYHSGDITLRHSRWPIISGERGEARVPILNHMMLGHNGMIWASDSWGFGVFLNDGRYIRLVGEAYDPDVFDPETSGVLGYWEDRDEMPTKLVGDWSDVPDPGLWENWGGAWLPETTRVEEINGEMRHPEDPVLILADTQKNRYLSVTFELGPDRNMNFGEANAKVRVWLDGMDDPWAPILGPDGSQQIATVERFSNRIKIWDYSDRHNPKLVRTLVDNSQDRDLMSWKSGSEGRGDRYANGNRNASIEHLKTRELVGPENGKEFTDDDGEHWIYLPSSASRQVLKFHWETAERVVVVSDFSSKNPPSPAVITVCDDNTVYPRGTVIVWSWTQRQYGAGKPYLNDQAIPSVNGFRRAPMNGLGHSAPDAGYAAAGAVGKGRLAWSGHESPLVLMSPAQEGDQAFDRAMSENGMKEWVRKGRRSIWGEMGFPYNSTFEMPADLSDDEKHYLDGCWAD